MVDLGLPYIEGYKPRGNFQALLADGVIDYLDANSGVLDALADAPLLNPERAPATAFDAVEEAPPERIIGPSESAKPWIDRKVHRIDFAARDAANRRLAELGEEWVVEVERYRLLTLGRDDLAGRVEWVSRTIGDGLGFDVLSFDERDDSERLIAVKTTGLRKYFPFCVTRNELRCSEDVERQFHLYKVFDFAKAPRLFVLRGSLQVTCRLAPVQFRATI